MAPSQRPKKAKTPLWPLNIPVARFITYASHGISGKAIWSLSLLNKQHSGQVNQVNQHIMNCPSRTDPNTLSNPHWNQQPCPLSPDLTTREDLNGISNTREHRDEAGLAGNPWAFLDKIKGISRPDGDPENCSRRTKGASLTLSGKCQYAAVEAIMLIRQDPPSLRRLPDRACRNSRVPRYGCSRCSVPQA